MAHRIERTRPYDDDLFRIWLSASDYSLTRADRLARKIETTVDMLADFPNLGEAVPQLAPNRRRKLCEDYVIYYDVLGETIVILRVLHAARDLGQFEDLRRS
jgi:toxin ParE1/3/4